MEKIPISFNEEDIKTIQEIASLIGIGGVYGETPKVIKYSIKLALATAKNPYKVYSGLEAPEMDFYFTSIKKALEKANLLKEAEKLQNQANKV